MNVILHYNFHKIFGLSLGLLALTSCRAHLNSSAVLETDQEAPICDRHFQSPKLQGTMTFSGVKLGVKFTVSANMDLKIQIEELVANILSSGAIVNVTPNNIFARTAAGGDPIAVAQKKMNGNSGEETLNLSASKSTLECGVVRTTQKSVNFAGQQKVVTFNPPIPELVDPNAPEGTILSINQQAFNATADGKDYPGTISLTKTVLQDGLVRYTFDVNIPAFENNGYYYRMLGLMKSASYLVEQAGDKGQLKEVSYTFVPDDTTTAFTTVTYKPVQ